MKLYKKVTYADGYGVYEFYEEVSALEIRKELAKRLNEAQSLLELLTVSEDKNES